MIIWMNIAYNIYSEHFDMVWCQINENKQARSYSPNELPDLHITYILGVGRTLHWSLIGHQHVSFSYSPDHTKDATRKNLDERWT